MISPVAACLKCKKMLSFPLHMKNIVCNISSINSVATVRLSINKLAYGLSATRNSGKTQIILCIVYCIGMYHKLLIALFHMTKFIKIGRLQPSGCNRLLVDTNCSHICSLTYFFFITVYRRKCVRMFIHLTCNYIPSNQLW